MNTDNGALQSVADRKPQNAFRKALPYIAAALLFGIFAMLYYQMASGPPAVIVREREKGQIVIHIVGEVAQEGVLRMEEGARVDDAITQAGGATERADLDDINLARMLEDGEKLVIPARATPTPTPIDTPPPAAAVAPAAETGETPETVGSAENAPQAPEATATSASASGPVNINTASSAELQQLPGIGPVIAGRIIQYRESKPFTKKSDIMKVKGIGQATYDDISGLITTGGD